MREKHLQGVCLCVNSQDGWGVVSAFGFCFRLPRRLLFFLTPKINHQKMPPRSMTFLLRDRLPITTWGIKWPDKARARVCLRCQYQEASHGKLICPSPPARASHGDVSLHRAYFLLFTMLDSYGDHTSTKL